MCVESVPGRGSRFNVAIPFGKDHLPADRVGRERTLAPTTIRADAFVEEALRLEPAAPNPFRLAVSDIAIAGIQIPAGSPVVLAYAAANRDPVIFPDPHRVDLDRDAPKPHLTFAMGPHFCIGNALARMEMRIGLEELLGAVRDIRFEGGGGRETITYAPTFTLHGPARLPIRFRPI